MFTRLLHSLSQRTSSSRVVAPFGLAPGEWEAGLANLQTIQTPSISRATLRNAAEGSISVASFTPGVVGSCHFRPADEERFVAVRGSGVLLMGQVADTGAAQDQHKVIEWQSLPLKLGVEVKVPPGFARCICAGDAGLVLVLQYPPEESQWVPVATPPLCEFTGSPLERLPLRLSEECFVNKDWRTVFDWRTVLGDKHRGNGWEIVLPRGSSEWGARLRAGGQYCLQAWSVPVEKGDEFPLQLFRFPELALNTPGRILQEAGRCL